MSNSCRSYYECINETISKDIGSANEVYQKCVEMKRLKILNDLTDNNKFSVIRINKKDHVNRIAISIITFKYAFILLVTIILICYLFFLFMIGITNLNLCSEENKSAIYLVVIGFIGILRIVLFYSCPFNFSESILKKLYEKLFKMLIINRCKYSYRTSKIIFRKTRPLKRFFYFFYNFFCSCCCSVKFKNNQIILKNNNLDSDLFDSYSNTQSNSNSETSAISIILHDLFCCLECIDLKSNNINDEKKNVLTLKRSVSLDQIKEKASKQSSLNNKKNFEREKFNDLYYIDKRLRYQHNKTQKDYKIIDKRSIRYGSAYLVQLILDIFMILWFICGIYIFCLMQILNPCY